MSLCSCWCLYSLFSITYLSLTTEMLLFLSIALAILLSSQSQCHVQSQNDQRILNAFEEASTPSYFIHHNHINNMGRIHMEVIMTKFGPNRVHITDLNSIDSQSISQLLDTFNVSYIFAKTPEGTIVDKHLFHVLDTVLAPRLWWIVKQYVLSTTSEGVVDHLDCIVFERAHPILENSLQNLREQNFPGTQAECAARPLAVANVNGDTWGNRAHNLLYFVEDYNKYATYLHATKNGSVTNPSAFASTSECLDKVNKHECVFLPSTNCSLPKTLVDGTDLKELSDPKTARLEYSKASVDGVKLDLHGHRDFVNSALRDHRVYRPTTEARTSSAKVYRIKSSEFYYRTKRSPMITPETVNTEIERNTDDNTIMYAPSINYLFGYIHRYNSEFRLRVQRIVDKFRASSNPPFLHNVSCVMIHARKNDRTIKDMDMLDWCTAHVKYNDETKKHSFTGKMPNGDIIGSSDMANLGCGMILPYGVASLEHFLNASLIVNPSAEHILIATDDQYWLQKAVTEYKQIPNNLLTGSEARHRLKLHRFHAKPGHRQASIDSAAEFFATIELGRQCEGFVGYPRTSAVAKLFYQGQCYQNNFNHLSCPDRFEMGGAIIT